jgi:hypothetical protein
MKVTSVRVLEAHSFIIPTQLTSSRGKAYWTPRNRSVWWAGSDEEGRCAVATSGYCDLSLTKDALYFRLVGSALTR